MRLTIPEPQITLYQDGFDGIDRYGRKEIGQRLSDLIEKIDDPMVIALDGGWGEGKTVFLKCWVGEHLKRDSNTTRTVYFDAFKHDFLDDPLIGLTGEIADRIAQDSNKTAAKIWDKARRVAPSLARGAFRAGVAIATAGIVQRADDLVDAAAESVGQDIAGSADTFWQAHQGRVEAMETFRAALVELTEPDEKGTPTRKLVLVVDELDRCRPDYALSMLEIIKHFFNVPGVHFVLGTSLTALENSVRARYGDGIDAGRYLQKFLSLVLRLEGLATPIERRDHLVQHFENCAQRLGYENDQRLGLVGFYLKTLQPALPISFRDIERLITKVLVTPVPAGNVTLGQRHLWASLVILQQFFPAIVKNLRAGGSSFEEIETVFGFSILDVDPHFSSDATYAWDAVFQKNEAFPGNNSLGFQSGWEEDFRWTSDLQRRLYHPQRPKQALQAVLQSCIDAFILPDEQ